MSSTDFRAWALISSPRLARSSTSNKIDLDLFAEKNVNSIAIMDVAAEIIATYITSILSMFLILRFMECARLMLH